jgi:hypothetical protein
MQLCNQRINQILNTKEATCITNSATCFGSLDYIEGHISVWLHHPKAQLYVK